MTGIEEIVQTSIDPSELQGAALALADGTDEAGHGLLRSVLLSDNFRDRLDAPGTWIAPSNYLRIGKVLFALAENLTAPAAHQTLAALTLDAVFIRNRSRVELLIRALTWVRPSPPEAIDFWDRHCRSLDGYCHGATRAIIENGSTPAIALFEKKMRDPAIEDSDKFYWLRTRVVGHRNDLLLLACCDRLLREGLSEALRPILVETLFDYRPDQWYMVEPQAVPPPRSALSSEGRELLKRIGAYALNRIALSEDQKKGVEATLAAL
jgi:hypothetical protein